MMILCKKKKKENQKRPNKALLQKVTLFWCDANLFKLERKSSSSVWVEGTERKVSNVRVIEINISGLSFGQSMMVVFLIHKLLKFNKIKLKVKH